jgi:glycerophosphoryl diester phosphodiesterase
MRNHKKIIYILFFFIVIFFVFDIFLFVKDLTPKKFISILNTKLNGPTEPNTEFNVNYLNKKNTKNLIFIGHKGGSPDWLFSENSINSLIFSKKMGISIFEIDVLLTKDKIPIVFHDPHLYRLTGVKHFVNEINYEQLKYIRLRDSQYIPRLDTLLNLFPDLLVDLTHNTIEDSKFIINFLILNKSIIKANKFILQTNSNEVINYIQSKNLNIKVSYNEWGDRIQNVNNYKDYSNIFTLNPSEQITKIIIDKLGKNKTIFAVVQNDNLSEIIRLQKLGIKYFMINNSILIGRETFLKIK